MHSLQSIHQLSAKVGENVQLLIYFWGGIYLKHVSNVPACVGCPRDWLPPSVLTEQNLADSRCLETTENKRQLSDLLLLKRICNIAEASVAEWTLLFQRKEKSGASFQQFSFSRGSPRYLLLLCLTQSTSMQAYPRILGTAENKRDVGRLWQLEKA